RPCSIACRGSRNRPPSEKESSVTLTMPITSGRWNDQEKGLARCQPQGWFTMRAASGAFGRRVRLDAAVAAVGRRGGLGRERLGRTRGAARHDVVDLVRVDRLPLEERLRHHLHLVAVFLEQAARERV